MKVYASGPWFSAPVGTFSLKFQSLAESVPEPVDEAVPEPVDESVPEPVDESVPEPAAAWVAAKPFCLTSVSDLRAVLDWWTKKPEETSLDSLDF